MDIHHSIYASNSTTKGMSDFYMNQQNNKELQIRKWSKLS